MSRFNLNAIVASYSDLLLAGLVVVIVSMMILPLPTWLLDILLTVNISLAITILLVTLYVPRALRIASFPTILLITTLFRLALNVSSTRLILLQANAGEVIQSFGNFVVQGNMVVGIIIFLILTIINFIVISKGAERVAEVGARFTLDAMPGKQMSIDADLRAGALDMNEARIKRREIERESQLFGAMDGAMKFVKGDAIAGMIITAINIVGGIIIGVLMKKMAFASSIKTYGLLTIGDGLVTQIPAFVISTSAGLVVTRVSPERENDHLAHEISTQLLSYPKAVAITSGLLFLLGIVPGMPTMPFWILATITGLLAFSLRRGCQYADNLPASGDSCDHADAASGSNRLIALPIPLCLSVSNKLFGFIADQDNTTKATNFATEISDKILDEIGLRLPGIKVNIHEFGLQDDQFIISIYDVPVINASIPTDRLLMLGAPSEIKDMCSDVQDAILPGTGEKASLLPIKISDQLKSIGLKAFSAREVLQYIVINMLKKNVHEFIGIQEVKWICDEIEQFYPDTIKEVVPRIISYRRLADVCIRLLREGISIRDFKKILETLAEYAPVEKDTQILVEFIRMRMARHISVLHADRNGSIHVFLLDPEIEDIFRDSIQVNQNEKTLAVDPDILDEIIDAFERNFQSHEREAKKIVLTTDYNIRSILWKFLSHQYENITVLSIQEIQPQFSLNPIRRISRHAS